MKNYAKLRILFLVAGLFGPAVVARAQIVVSVDRNVGPAINKDFKFKTLRVAPAKDDAAAKATVKLLSGEADPESGDLSVLTDGALPAKDDDAKANFFFANGSGGGRFLMDLGLAIDIKQVNSYSWHSGARAPQVYMLYASDGSAPHFCAEPGADADLTGCGWKFITAVDTRKNSGDGGGQYVVSIGGPKGIGNYRYLIFVVSASETDDDFGNTFFSEIDVIASTSKK